jgi:hypothetical protein
MWRKAEPMRKTETLYTVKFGPPEAPDFRVVAFEATVFPASVTVNGRTVPTVLDTPFGIEKTDSLLHAAGWGRTPREALEVSKTHQNTRVAQLRQDLREVARRLAELDAALKREEQ